MSKQYHPYTREDIEALHKQFERGTRLETLAVIFERTAYAIMKRLSRFSREEPGRWSAERVAKYREQYRVIRKGNIERMRMLGYVIEGISRNKNSLAIQLSEENLDKESVVKDFRDHVLEAMVYAKIQDLGKEMSVDFRAGRVVIRFDLETREGEELTGFLEKYESVLERERK